MLHKIDVCLHRYRNKTFVSFLRRPELRSSSVPLSISHMRPEYKGDMLTLANPKSVTLIRSFPVMSRFSPFKSRCMHYQGHASFSPISSNICLAWTDLPGMEIRDGTSDIDRETDSQPPWKWLCPLVLDVSTQVSSGNVF
jgi:hypothetical protein